MRNKRKPTLHEKQVRFFTFLCGTLMVLLVVAVLWFMNSVWPLGH